ncbi:hypothetical protein SPM24T3_12219 [Serratia sp. M24T3]|nr:hypothetical protein SPM24T3_12219 [Serratia sp. M24T3]
MASGLIGREKFNHYLFIFVVALLIFILPYGYTHEKTSRELFYFCSYLSITGIVINYREFKRIFSSTRFAMPLIALAILYFSWSLFATVATPDKADEWVLFTASKRWFLSGIIAFYVCWAAQEHRLSASTLKRLALASLFAAFVAASVYGVWLHFTKPDRVVLGISRATLTAYAYSALALSIMTLIARNCTSGKKYLGILLMTLVSLYIIFLTETRSSMVLHLILSVLLVLATLWQDKKLTPKSLGILILLVVVVVGGGSQSKIVQSRFDLTCSELQMYKQGDDQSSLGSRFTMWKMGIIAFKEYPFGQTETGRNQRIRQYLDSHNQSHSFALRYIDVHLHNEFIQLASLSGIFGILALLYFFIALMFRNGISGFLLNPVSMVALSAFLYGLTDVLLISEQYIVLFSMIILLSWICTRSEKRPD